MDRKFYLVNCAEFPEYIKVDDPIDIKMVDDIPAAYYEGRFIGSVSGNYGFANCKVVLIGTNVHRNMKLLVEAA